MNAYITAILIGISTGVFRALSGFFKKSSSWKDFNSFRFVKTLVLNLIAMTTASLTSNPQTIALSSLLGDHAARTLQDQLYKQKGKK